MGQNENKWEKIFWVTKRDNKGITNRGKKITNRGRDFKSGQGFQIGADITNRGKRGFKSGQGLQIGAEHL